MEVFQQNKLSKTEWDSIETPVFQSEKQILELIKNGFHDTNIMINNTYNLSKFTKIEINSEIEHFLFLKYFQKPISDITSKYCKKYPDFQNINNSDTKLKKIKSIDSIRLRTVDDTINSNREKIIEFILIDFCKNVLKGIRRNLDDLPFNLYTLIKYRQICNDTILQNTNEKVISFVDLTIEKAKENVSIQSIINQCCSILETNKYLSYINTITLHSHQKELFQFCNVNYGNPKLILYTAPTGTGKTLSPIGLSEKYKVLFVCIGRHIGLSLAKSAVSVNKRVAFAFGCETASDIRLHYFAAVNYDVNKKTGKISKVDNSEGSKVEIMICDAQSYIPAMHYMMSFNNSDDIITYWDEPTMTLDYDCGSHCLHSTIQSNWKQNLIPNMILSCATLPKQHYIMPVVMDFRNKFGNNVLIETITSHDYVKTIPIINSNGKCFLPHIEYETGDELIAVSRYIQNNKTLLRYIDLEGIATFIKIIHYINSKCESKGQPPIIDRALFLETVFQDISSITIESLKQYYIDVLINMDYMHFDTIKELGNKMQKPKFQTEIRKSLYRSNSNQEIGHSNTHETNIIKKQKSDTELNSSDPYKGIRITTNDAFTLTDGPTIYLTDNVINVAKFYIAQSGIPNNILNGLLNSINNNKLLQEQIVKMEQNLEAKMEVNDNTDKTTENTSSKKKKLKEKDTSKNEITESLEENIEQLRKQIRTLSLPPEYIPNTSNHQEKWTPDNSITKNAFTSKIDATTVKEIMDLDVEPYYQLLVLMGVGILVNHENKTYQDVVKRLASEQRLYLIITSSDYIYGTNYQFCHGFLGKDLGDTTQQKILQCIGRVGRNNNQHTFTVRFRNDSIIKSLFKEPEHNKEADNMNILFSSD